MTADERTAYILACIGGAGSMSREKAQQILADHDTEVRAKALEEKAEEVFEDTRQRYSQVIATHGADKAALWFTGRENAAKLIAAPASGNGAETAPGFFQPGHSYTHRDGTTFRCDAVTTHPESGQRLALGWRTDVADWTFLAHRNLGQWLHEYDSGKPPTVAPTTPGRP